MNNRIPILVVEDDSDISNMISDLLKQNGYNAKSAYSGTEALMVFDKKLIWYCLTLCFLGLTERWYWETWGTVQSFST